MKAALAWLKATQAYRAWQRYNAARGGLLAGGVAYFAFFSVFPALTLAFAIFGFVLRGHPGLFHDVVHSISTTLPGIVKDSSHPDGIIDASKPPTPNALTVTGAISLVVLVFSGLGWLSNLREGIRAMFDLETFKANPVLGRLRDLGVLALLGLSMLVSGALSGASNTATSHVLGWLHISTDSLLAKVLLPVVTALVVFVVDVGIYVIVLRLLSGVDMPWRHLRSGVLFAAVGSGVIKLAVGYGIVGTSKNALLASFAVVVGLLVVMNLLSRVTLLAAAWAATSRAEAAVADELGSTPAGAAAVPAPRRPQPAAAASAGAGAASARASAGPVDLRDMPPSFGQRSADRTAVAAGAVLGAVGTVGFGVLRRGARSAWDALRRKG